jgi:hypothetical protein
MKILILCIFDETDRNNKLLQIQRDNFVKNDLIDYYFITYDPNLDDDFKLTNDTLFIKGNEGYMNILDKTIKSLRYFSSIKDYNFIVRTNISTAFNYNLLCDYLREIPANNIYIGGLMYNLRLIDEKSGITKDMIEKYLLRGMWFYQGTCIVLSSDVVKFMLENHDKLRYEIIDDVSIALFIRTYLPNAYFKDFFKGSLSNMMFSYICEKNKTYNPNSVIYRHKSLYADEDSENMIKTFKIINSITPDTDNQPATNQ